MKELILFPVYTHMKHTNSILGLSGDEVLSMVDGYVGASIEKLGNMLEPTYRMGTVQYAWTTLLDSLTRGRADTPCRPEEVAAILIRGGLPRESVRATAGNITISLPNGCYRIYRDISRYPAGSFSLRYPEWLKVRRGLSARELADFLVAFDALIPEIAGREQPLRDEYERKKREIKAKTMAADIAKQSIEAILDNLAHMRLDHYVKVHDDGTVTVVVKQELFGEVRALFEISFLKPIVLLYLHLENCRVRPFLGEIL